MPTQPQHSAKAPSERDVLGKAVVRAAKGLEMAQGDLAQTIGVSASTASRLFSNHRSVEPSSKEAELVILFLRMYRSLSSLFESDDASRKWFHGHNYHLSGTPAQLVKKVDGLVHVIQYLDAMRGKT
jgi:transcriptional regulator with XRE-family HTH domain